MLSIGISVPWFGIYAFVESLGSRSGSCGNGAEWYLDKATGELTISGTGSTGSYQLVSGIKAPWDKYRKDILHVKINEGITAIGNDSFRECKNLLDVSLPESLKEISEMSFSGCNKLQAIDIPTNVNKIDASAFFECSVLERVTVSSRNTDFSDVDGVLFNKNKTNLLLFPKGRITQEYTIPLGVTEIGAYAFANCSELIYISIPSTVRIIGVHAFVNCRTLFSAEIPEGVTAIKPNAFYGCSALSKVKLPSTVTSVSSNAFGKCGSLLKINIPNATKSIDASAFSGCPNLTVYCDKDSYANGFCISSSIDYCYSNLSSVYPIAEWIYNDIPHLGQRRARIEVKCTWKEAKRACEMLGGHLATICSAEEMETVRDLLSRGLYDAYWLGASDEREEGTWEWVTGEPFDYSLWGANQPDDCGGVEDYLEAWGRGASWNDNNLYGTENETGRGFVCEFENYFIPSKTITYNGHIYCRYDEQLPWHKAKEICQGIGGHLATITSEEEQRVIEELCSGSFYPAYWLGATDEASEGDWKWVTGEPFSYTKWASGQPDNYKTLEHYLEHNLEYNNAWNDNEVVNYRGFICEIEPFSALPVASGYFKGNRYEVYNDNLTWLDEQQIAQSKGGHLATVTDSDEASYVYALYKDLALDDKYLNIGGFRYKHEPGYRWITGESFAYSNWDAEEPNGYTGFENYIQINRYTNGWNDIGNKGHGYDGSVFIVEYESPKQVLTLSNLDGSVINRYKVQGGLPVDKPLKDYKPGYTAEWYKEPSLQNKWNFETDVITADTVLYARWVANTYAVSFDANGGECSGRSKEVTFGRAYGELPDCSREGYSFMGWYTDESCTVKADENTIVSVAGDHTLFAKWQAKAYTVTFESNGGKSDKASKTVSFGEPYGELPGCSLPGADFMGWYSDKKCTEKITEDTVVETAENHILYAGWYKSAVTKLRLASKPTKTDYYVGDTLDTTGLSAVAAFENGSAAQIDADSFEYSLTEFNSAGKKIIKASYGGKYVSFIVNVSARALVSASIATLPGKTSYTVGEALDTTGLELTVVYDNSSAKTITEGFTATGDLDTLGAKTVTVSYTENGKTVSASYQITVNPKVIEPNAVISADSVSASAGETVSVPFRIDGNKGFMGFAITVAYDSDAFTPVSVTGGSMLGGGTLNDSIGTAYEYLKIVYVSSEDVAGDGTLFTVDFLANEAAAGRYTFDVSYLQPDTFNEAGKDVAFDCGNFDVSVSNSVVEQSVKINGGVISAQAGSSVTLTLRIENSSGMTSFELKMKYNGEVLAFSEVKNGEVLTGENIRATVGSTNELLLAWSGSALAGDGALLYVTFEIKDYVQSAEAVSVLCTASSFNDGSARNIICSDAEINISNPYADKNAVIYSGERLRCHDSIIEVPIYIKNNQGIMGLGLNIEYDSSVVTPVSATAGEMLASGMLEENIGTTDGSFKILWNHSENVAANGLLMTLRFAVSEGATPEKIPMTIICSQPDTYNESWQDVFLEYDSAGGKISYIFTATFTHNGEVIGTDEFTLDDDSLDYPAIEQKPHYEWVWEEHSLAPCNMTVSGRYVPIEYRLFFYFRTQQVATLTYTVETDAGKMILPPTPKLEGYTVEWPKFSLSYKDESIYAVCTPITYVASFVADDEVIATRPFTVETERLDEPDVPQKAGYIAAWSGYAIKAEDLTIRAKYYLPEAVMVSRRTINVEETTRLLPFCNFDTTNEVWSSSDPSVATVDTHGNVTAVGKGECYITVICYGKDSLGNDIFASSRTEIIVKEKLNAETLKQRFRANFDDFFKTTLHDFLYNFKKFMALLLRYAY